VLAASVLRMQLSLVVVPPDAQWRASPDIIAEMLNAIMRQGRAAGARPRRRQFSR
jgi:hypothetical protein